MKIFVRDLRDLGEHRVQFSITLADDNGEPLVTQRGYTIDWDRAIRPPATRTKYGKVLAITDLAPKFEESIKRAVLEMEGVEDVLGQRPEKPEPQGKLPGEKRVL